MGCIELALNKEIIVQQQKILLNKANIKSKNSKMLGKVRPHSAIKRPLTAVPRQTNENIENDQSVIVTQRETLNNLIPDLPAFLTKNKSSTAMLYSKFIMKGIKTNKIDLVKESFNMKKQNLRYDKKMSLNTMKTMRSTRNSTKNQALKSIRNQPNEQIQFDDNKTMKKDNDSRILNLQINNFFKVGSNRKSTQNQTQRKLTNIKSEKLISRPKSAVSTPYKAINSNRAQTANVRKTLNSYNRQISDIDEFTATIPEKNLLTIIASQRPELGFINYIQRNKRQLSASSKKTSIYLTGVEGNKIVQNLNKEIRKIPAKKFEQNLKSHAHKKSMPDFLSEFPQENRLSHNQIQSIKKTNKANAEFMKNNMPKQYKKFVEFLAMRENNFTQKDNVLISAPLEEKNQFGQINLNSKNQDQAMDEARDYFNEYAHICEETEYYINKNLKKKSEPKTFNEILHVGMCQELLQLEKQKSKISRKTDELPRLKAIKERISQIVNILAFFKSKSKQVKEKIFQLDFQIFSLEQDAVIIKRDDQINKFYVILNGSVIKSSKTEPTEDSPITSLEPQIYTNTLFDGQTFGEPQNQSQTKHRHQYKSAQKVLLLTFSYFDYKSICSESQNINDRIQLLKEIFGSVPGCKPLDNSNLEALAFQLQACSFDAKNVVFRRGDFCDKLIIVASGQISMVNQHVLKRTKKNSKDIKKQHKSTQKLKIQNFSVQKLRRNNLKNYEVLTQNEEEFIFYYQDIAKQYIRGQAINWQGFSHNYMKTVDQDISIQVQEDKFQSKTMNDDQYKLQYSLISNTDNSKIYTLNLARIKNLPELLKQTIYAKIQDVFKNKKKTKQTEVKSQKLTNIQKWDTYKQKICTDIISRKLKH